MIKHMFDKKIKWSQLSQRQRMSPFPNYLSMEAITKEMRAVFSYAYEQVIMIFQENIMQIFMDKDDHERVGRGIMRKVLLKPDIFVRLAKKQKHFAKNFYKFLWKNNKPGNLRKLSASALASLHEEYEKRYKQVYSHYFGILAIEIYFFDYLRDYVNSREPDKKKAAQYIDILITERGAMVNRQETTAALRLCEEIKTKKKWISYFNGQDADAILARIRRDKELFRLMKSHEKKFFWITRDYEDLVLTLADFIIRFKKHFSGQPGKALRKLQAEDKKLARDIAGIARKLGMDKKHARLFQTMREGIYYKELRKSIVSQTLYYYDPILSEIARRGGLSLRQARMLKTDEAAVMLENKIEMTDDLNQRIALSVYHVKKGKTKVYTGKQAKAYYDFFVKIDKSAKVLYGTGVSAGVAQGPARIVINPDAFPKVKPGDIIVTLQATPVFSHVLSIAAGLVCDGGPGITSHPATLAREAGIPGVIGAAGASKILKDGQIVEVDGNEGVVKIGG